MTVEFNI